MKVKKHRTAQAGLVERRVILETIVSIFIGGALDGKNVDHKINGDIKTDGEIYFLREYWMRDGIGGTVHAIKFLISSNISDREAVFRIEQHLTHNAERSAA